MLERFFWRFFAVLETDGRHERQISEGPVLAREPLAHLQVVPLAPRTSGTAE